MASIEEKILAITDTDSPLISKLPRPLVFTNGCFDILHAGHVSYLEQAKKADVSKGEISEVLAKVMAVAAGQKRLQMQEVLGHSGADVDSNENEA